MKKFGFLIDARRNRYLFYVLRALASGAGLALVFASGALVQAISIAFLSGSSSSLYDGENVNRALGLKAYLAIAVWPPHLVAGLVSAIVMLFMPTKKYLLMWGALAVGTSLTLIDFFYAGDDMRGLAVSALCNYLAGFLLAVFTLVLALNFSMVRGWAEGSPWIKKLLWITWPFLGYAVLASFLFIVLSFLTTIPSTPTSFRLKPSLNGYYVTDERSGCAPREAGDGSRGACGSGNEANSKSHELEQKKFSVLGKFTGRDKGSVEYIGGKRLAFEWRKGSGPTRTGALWVAQGCIKTDELEQVLASEPIFRGDLEVLKIALDEGMSEFRVIDPNSQYIEIEDDNSVVQFSVTPLKADIEGLRVVRFLHDGTIRTYDRFGVAKYALAVYPLAKGERGPVSQSRRITYTINDEIPKNIDISLASNLLSPDAALSCEILPTYAMEGGVSASTKSLYVSLIVSIEAPKMLNLEKTYRNSHALVSGATGWVSSRGYAEADFDEAVVGGELSQLSLIGVVKDLVVDGHSVVTGDTSTLQVSGKLTARTDGPAILVEGKVDYLILNGKRLSTTRWEQLDPGVRIPIILGVPTAAFFFLNFVIATLRRRVDKIWPPFNAEH